MIELTYTVIGPSVSPSGGAAAPNTSTLTLDQVIPIDIARDLATGDMAIPPAYVRGADAVCQWLSLAYTVWLGEWFLDQRIGVPYIQKIFVKNPSLPLIERIYRRATLKCPGIVKVNKFSMAVDFPTRTLEVTELEASLVTGDTFVATTTPFIIASN